ncbi:MAG: hypothetical protein NVS9B1_25240 [Candidatus Dormibacteraceae bacterium]
MTLAETNRQIWASQQVGFSRQAEVARLRSLIRAVDTVLNEVEHLNLRDVKTVPPNVRDQAVDLIAEITGYRPERVPTRGHTILDALYEAQERLLRAKTASIDLHLDGDELEND